MISNKKYCLLLTASISPPQQSFLLRSNHVDRLEDYISALAFWSRMSLPIVFVDNSNFPLNSIEKERFNNNQIEFLQISNNDVIRGKGYGEVNIIDWALKKSEIIHNSDMVFKVTGRFKVLNFDRIYNSVLSEKENHFIYATMSKNFTVADSRFYLFAKKHFADYFQKFADQIDDSKKLYFEHILAKSILLSIADGKKWSMFPEAPIYKGYYGTSNKKYKHNIIYKIKKKFIYKLKKYFISK
ncbi:MAG: hypothetical protein P1P88_18640 [Bacteroidales bacterium]|nr:hypothetical protein [Bacteroidales bacterium]